jgi:hypothetical protein
MRHILYVTKLPDSRVLPPRVANIDWILGNQKVLGAVGEQFRFKNALSILSLSVQFDPSPEPSIPQHLIHNFQSHLFSSISENYVGWAGHACK